jgi:hypothetical protein
MGVVIETRPLTCMHALQLNYTVETTDEGRHDTTRGGHSGRGPH